MSERLLERLLERWRKTRAPSLGDAIDLLSAHLEPHPEPLTVESWRQLVREQRSADLTRLLAAVTPAMVEGSVVALADWPRDPRLALAVVSWIDAGATGTPRFWELVGQIIGASGDARLLHRLGALFRHTTRAGEARGAHLRAHVAPQLPALSISQALTDEDHELVARARALSIGLLWDAVYAAPHDDALRAVLADRLLEVGDRRGELIALQLAGKKEHADRIAALVKLPEMQGALFEAIVQRTVRFERGLLAYCRPKHDAFAQRLARRPEWSTFRELDIDGHPLGAHAALLLSPALVSLENVRLHLREPSDLVFLEAAPPLPWRKLALNGDLQDIHLDDVIGAADVLPRLETVDVLGEATPLSRWIALANRLPHTVRSLNVRTTGTWWAVVVRDQGGQLRDVTLRHMADPRADPGGPALLEQLLAGVPNDGPTHLRLDWDTPETKRVIERFRAASVG
jgi:uncharacterized protein (TIGR02996 family)